MDFSKIKPQVIRYRKYKGFHDECFLDPLIHDLNIQGSRFVNKKALHAFSTICTEVFAKYAPKKSDLYDLNINLSLIVKRLRQSW